MFYIADAAIDGTTPCNGGPGVVGANCDATNNELCSGNPGVCECDAASGYEVSSGDSTVCALVGKVFSIRLHIFIIMCYAVFRK